MKRISILAVSLSTLLLAGSAFAQEGTTRGGAASSMPSTQQNSPLTGETTGANPATGVNAAPRYPATSGAAVNQAPGKTMKLKKKHAAIKH
jgi:hypothetical protein